MSVLHIPIVHARQQTNRSRKKNFLRDFYFRILLLKNWLRLRRKFKLNMESCKPADEEELLTFSLGVEFLTLQVELSVTRS